MSGMHTIPVTGEFRYVSPESRRPAPLPPKPGMSGSAVTG